MAIINKINCRGGTSTSPDSGSFVHHVPQVEIRTTLSVLYEEVSSSRGPALGFVRSRVEQMSQEWIQAGLRMKQSRNNTASPQMKVGPTSSVHQ